MTKAIVTKNPIVPEFAEIVNMSLGKKDISD